MNTAHAATLPFRDNRLRSKVPTWASTLACTSDQFHSSWRQGPNHTPRMRTDPSHQRKGPGMGSPPFQAPKRKPSLLLMVILAPAICLHLATALFTAFISRRWDTKTMISSAYADTYTERGAAKSLPRRAVLVFSSLNLRSNGSKIRT